MRISKPLSFLLAVLVALANESCVESVNADFELELDPIIPGKINVINNSTNVKTYEWEMLVSESIDGSYSYSSQYGFQSYGENPSWYAEENGWVKIDLRALGGVKEDYATRKIEVTNIPDTLAFGNFVITEIDFRDQNGFEWDDTDGVANSGDYSSSSAYPDLLVNGEEYDNTHFSSDVFAWDVNLETDLPLSIPMEKPEIQGISAQTWDVYTELIDYDPPQGFGDESGKRMGIVRFDPYLMTHKQDGGNDENYPSRYVVDATSYRGYIELIWR